MSLRDSTATTSKQPLRESQFIERLNQPISTHLIKELSVQASLSSSQKNKTFKVKKFESLESSSTVDDVVVGEQAKFIGCYNSDRIFRKKVDFLIKEHEKRLKQENPIVSGHLTTQVNHTWRTQKNNDDIKLVEMYEKCKKWILMAKQKK